MTNTQTKYTVQELIIKYLETRSDKYFTKLYDKLYGPLVNFANKIINDLSRAEELVQNSFGNAIISIDRYTPEKGQFTTWLYTIVRNECFQYLRTKRLTVLTDFDKPTDDDNHNVYTSTEWMGICTDANMTMNTEEHEALDEAEITKLNFIQDSFAKLPNYYRDIFIDIIIKGMKYEDCARKHNIKINTVKSRLYNAKKILKNAFETGSTIKSFVRVSDPRAGGFEELATRKYVKPPREKEMIQIFENYEEKLKYTPDLYERRYTYVKKKPYEKKRKKVNKIECPHCGKVAYYSQLKYSHFDNCRVYKKFKSKSTLTDNTEIEKLL